jgi:hypothetical protein
MVNVEQLIQVDFEFIQSHQCFPLFFMEIILVLKSR